MPDRNGDKRPFDPLSENESTVLSKRNPMAILAQFAVTHSTRARVGINEHESRTLSFSQLNLTNWYEKN